MFAVAGLYQARWGRGCNVCKLVVFLLGGLNDSEETSSRTGSERLARAGDRKVLKGDLGEQSTMAAQMVIQNLEETAKLLALPLYSLLTLGMLLTHL